MSAAGDVAQPPPAGHLPEADIHQALVDDADAGRAVALAVILSDTGSAPRKAGTKALVDATGAIRGTIGGGPVEAEAQRRAVDAIRTGRPVVFDVPLEGTSAAGASPICGGRVRILIDPTAAAHRAAFAAAVQARRERRRGTLVTTVHPGPPVRTEVRFVAEGGKPEISGTLPLSVTLSRPAGASEGSRCGRCLSAVERQQPRRDSSASLREGRNDNALEVPETCDAAGAETRRAIPGTEAPAAEVLVEPLVPPPLLVIAGGGHIGQALAVHAGLVGFDVLVLDDRSEFVEPSLYPPDVATRCGDVAAALAGLPIDGGTFIAIVTRGHQHDRQALAACIRAPAAYVGMIGSRRKVAIIRRDLLESGTASADEIARVYAPIGLDIGAETVPEIAASIVAQLIAVRRRGDAPRVPIE